jgi:DNA-binding MarR family transcriptional regulator
MDQETVRKSFNKFLKMYFDSCKEVYQELDLKELTGRQFAYLRAIDKNEKVTVTDLADILQLSKPSVTELIKKFEDSHLIEKTRCEDDGRVSYISLTKQGKLLANSNVLESKRAVEKIFQQLSQEDIQTLVTLFDQFGGMTS